MSTFDRLVDDNLARARAKHRRPYTSYHHAYAVMLEEFDELWDEIKKQRGKRSCVRLLAELVDIATVARRAAEDMKLLTFADQILNQHSTKQV